QSNPQINSPSDLSYQPNVFEQNNYNVRAQRQFNQLQQAVFSQSSEQQNQITLTEQASQQQLQLQPSFTDNTLQQNQQQQQLSENVPGQNVTPTPSHLFGDIYSDLYDTQVSDALNAEDMDELEGTIETSDNNNNSNIQTASDNYIDDNDVDQQQIQDNQQIIEKIETLMHMEQLKIDQELKEAQNVPDKSLLSHSSQLTVYSQTIQYPPSQSQQTIQTQTIPGSSLPSSPLSKTSSNQHSF
ncbi:MAG: hypothetical protein EZS28_054038, partial [Streblomastix strix]